MNTTTRVKIEILEDALRKASNQEDVRLVLKDSLAKYNQDIALEFEVTWVSKGPQSTEDTKDFCNRLESFIVIAQRLNYFEFHITENEDDTIKCRNDYEAWVDKLVGAFPTSRNDSRYAEQRELIQTVQEFLGVQL